MRTATSLVDCASASRSPFSTHLQNAFRVASRAAPCAASPASTQLARRAHASEASSVGSNVSSARRRAAAASGLRWPEKAASKRLPRLARMWSSRSCCSGAKAQPATTAPPRRPPLRTALTAAGAARSSAGSACWDGARGSLSRRPPISVA